MSDSDCCGLSNGANYQIPWVISGITSKPMTGLFVCFCLSGPELGRIAAEAKHYHRTVTTPMPLQGQVSSRSNIPHSSYWPNLTSSKVPVLSVIPQVVQHIATCSNNYQLKENLPNHIKESTLSTGKHTFRRANWHNSACQIR